MDPELKLSIPLTSSVFSYWKEASVNFPLNILFWLVEDMGAFSVFVLLMELSSITPILTSCMAPVVQEMNRNLG